MARNPWLPYTSVATRGLRVRLFCFHFAGGSAAAFRPWCRDAPADVEVCPVQLPGREARFGEPRYQRLKPLVHAALQGLAEELTTPFAFFGHSMGAKLAFEMTRTLVERGGPTPRHLFVSAARGPTVPHRERLRYNLPAAELIGELRTLGGTDDEALAHDELMAIFLPIVRDDFEVVETYQLDHECTVDVPMSVLGGTSDDSVTQDDLDAWGMHATGYFHRHMVDGGHFFLTERPREVLDFVVARLRGHPVSR